MTKPLLPGVGGHRRHLRDYLLTNLSRIRGAQTSEEIAQDLVDVCTGVSVSIRLLGEDVGLVVFAPNRGHDQGENEDQDGGVHCCWKVIDFRFSHVLAHLNDFNCPEKINNCRTKEITKQI
jgi:hypothetical protein